MVVGYGQWKEYSKSDDQKRAEQFARSICDINSRRGFEADRKAIEDCVPMKLGKGTAMATWNQFAFGSHLVHQNSMSADKFTTDTYLAIKDWEIGPERIGSPSEIDRKRWRLFRPLIGGDLGEAMVKLEINLLLRNSRSHSLSLFPYSARRCGVRTAGQSPRPRKIMIAWSTKFISALVRAPIRLPILVLGTVVILSVMACEAS